jgi:ADP-glucose pyrophosphorylase
MNDQIITDHAEAADFYVGNNYYNESYEEQQRLFVTRLAELIIQDCIQLADDEASRFYNMDEDELGSIMENFREKLKEHFGLQE